MKKTIIIILSIILVLLPSITALVLQLMPESVIATPINISGKMTDGERISYDFSRANNVFLASFFDSIYDNSVESEVEPNNYDKAFSVDITKKNEKTNITLYLSIADACYFKDGSTTYRINTEYADTLLNSQYAIGIYEELYTPALKTFSNDIVVPSRTDFSYITKNSGKMDQHHIATTNQVVTYYSSDTSLFSFSTKPTYGNIKAYAGDTLLCDDLLYDFDPSKLPKNSVIRYEVDVTWVKDSSSNCFGSASYTFCVDYSPAPVFSINKTKVGAGEFVVIKADNIRDASKINCTLSNKISPVFFENNGSYYSLIPIDINSKTGYQRLTLECGETKKTFNIHVSARNRDKSSKQYEIENPLTQDMITDMNSLISTIGSKCDSKLHATDTFLNYEKDCGDKFDFVLNFGRIRPFNIGESFDMIGIEYTCYSTTEIPAINAGVVCATGENNVLGKYVVIDHGYGLKSWYCNISETSLSVGDSVSKGDTVAMSGSSAFYGKEGVLLMTTILGTPVSPETLTEEGFLLSK